MTAASIDEKAVLRLEGEATIYQAAELKQTVLSALKQGTTLEVDLSGITEIDTAGVQILLLAKRTAQARNGELRLAGHSAAVLEVLDLLDLIPYFGDAVVMPNPTARYANES